MFESATEFSVKSRFLGRRRCDIFVPGVREPVARMERKNRDEHGKKIAKNYLRISIGSKFEHTIGYIGPNRTAFDATDRKIGAVLFDGGFPNGLLTAEFEQIGSGTLNREYIRKKGKGITRRSGKPRRLAMIREEFGKHTARYASNDCAGFTVSIPRRGAPAEFSVHDNRVSRLLMLATFEEETKRGLYAVIGWSLLIVVLYPFSR
ncbi:hypothetical protein [Nocardia miyunensis]|uniref:hypothetical protein n=1 Tax=Nocardia miyunensis TaxID=282684 RepID=UPI000AB9C0D2|nr:hypothetical protein [Nocardia miyunensis]